MYVVLVACVICLSVMICKVCKKAALAEKYQNGNMKFLQMEGAVSEFIW